MPWSQKTYNEYTTNKHSFYKTISLGGWFLEFIFSLKSFNPSPQKINTRLFVFFVARFVVLNHLRQFVPVSNNYLCNKGARFYIEIARTYLKQRELYFPPVNDYNLNLALKVSTFKMQCLIRLDWEWFKDIVWFNEEGNRFVCFMVELM